MENNNGKRIEILCEAKVLFKWIIDKLKWYSICSSTQQWNKIHYIFHVMNTLNVRLFCLRVFFLFFLLSLLDYWRQKVVHTFVPLVNWIVAFNLFMPGCHKLNITNTLLNNVNTLLRNDQVNNSFSSFISTFFFIEMNISLIWIYTCASIFHYVLYLYTENCLLLHPIQ